MEKSKGSGETDSEREQVLGGVEESWRNVYWEGGKKRERRVEEIMVRGAKYSANRWKKSEEIEANKH